MVLKSTLKAVVNDNYLKETSLFEKVDFYIVGRLTDSHSGFVYIPISVISSNTVSRVFFKKIVC